MLQNIHNMGNQPHHRGSIGGGINLSKTKTPNDADIRYMPVDNRASIPFHQGERLKDKISTLSKKHKKLKDAYDMGQKVNENKLFRIEDRLEKKEQKYVRKFGGSPYSLVDYGRKSKSSTPPKQSIKQKIGKAARALEAKAPKVVQEYFKGLRERQ